MQTTPYFELTVLYKRPDIRRDWCEQALARPIRREVQADGRIRHWTFIPDLRKYLRVITLEDGETVHNAFFDRRFKA